MLGFLLQGVEVSPVASYGYKMANSDKKGYFSALKFNNFLSSIPGIRIKIRNWIPIHTDLKFCIRIATETNADQQDFCD